MRTIFTLTIAALVTLAQQALALPPQVPQIELTDTAAEPAPQGGSTRIAARIVNPTSQTVTVTGISSPIAEQTKLLTFGKTEDGFTNISESDTLLIPPGETLLIPNVLELRLIGLSQPLTAGNELPIGFRFGNGTGRVFKISIKE